ncbi:WXG100 family type VII secretion target [Kitasatospora sp. NPDC006697]|uniref:WXG100 family type VII secretion target n=1 Tax=Kitasatospora sp. NPDC006697 TaxID=3364020 RepID=UPI0036CC9CDE
MADIQLQHESIDNAFQELLQAAQTMQSNLDELVQQLQGLASQSGSYKEAFHEFFAVVHQNEGQMHEDIKKGAQILDQMNHTMRYADQSAAAGF